MKKMVALYMYERDGKDHYYYYLLLHMLLLLSCSLEASVLAAKMRIELPVLLGGEVKISGVMGSFDKTRLPPIQTPENM